MARSWQGRVLCGVLGAVALLNGGCVAVVAGAAAAGGAGGYAYYKGKVTRTYVANLDDVFAATKTALGELGMSLVSQEKTTSGGTIQTKAGSDPVQITFDVQPGKLPADRSLTVVGVRVATFGDEALSNRILDQMSAHLVPTATTPPPLPAPGGVTLARPVETPPPPLAK